MLQRIKKDQKTGGAPPPHYQRLMHSWVGKIAHPHYDKRLILRRLHTTCTFPEIVSKVTIT